MGRHCSPATAASRRPVCRSAPMPPRAARPLPPVAGCHRGRAARGTHLQGRVPCRGSGRHRHQGKAVNPSTGIHKIGMAFPCVTGRHLIMPTDQQRRFINFSFRHIPRRRDSAAPTARRRTTPYKIVHTSTVDFYMQIGTTRICIGKAECFTGEETRQQKRYFYTVELSTDASLGQGISVVGIQ